MKQEQKHTGRLARGLEGSEDSKGRLDRCLCEVGSCLKGFWFSKDNSTGHSEWKREEEVDRKRGGKTILRLNY